MMMDSAERLAAMLVDALNNRVRIEQAKGVLARVHSISVDQAFGLLWLYASTHQRALGDLARAVTEDAASVPGLTIPHRPDV